MNDRFNELIDKLVLQCNTLKDNKNVYDDMGDGKELAYLSAIDIENAAKELTSCLHVGIPRKEPLVSHVVKCTINGETTSYTTFAPSPLKAINIATINLSPLPEGAMLVCDGIRFEI